MLVSAALAALLASAAPSAFPETALAPVLGAGAAAARADLEAGRHAALAARLAEDPRPEVLFLRAVALQAGGRPGEALAALDRIGGALPELAHRVAFLRGRALEALGRREAAAAAHRDVPDASVLGPAARLARARLLGAERRPADALGALAPLVAAPPPRAPAAAGSGARAAGAGDPRPAALLLAARLHASSDPPAPAAARRALLDCWADHPLSPEAPRCLKALRALPGEHGEAPPPEETARRAEALLDANRAPAAAALLRRLLPGLPEAGGGEPFACAVRLSLGRAHRLTRRYGAALALLRPVAARCADPGVRTGALHLVGEALAARGAHAEAVATYRRLAAQDPASPLAHQALYSAAMLLARDGRAAEAAEAFAGVERTAPPGTLRDEARFRVAWLAKRAGDTDGAIARLLVLEADARGRDSYEEARAAYWRARLLEGAGEAGRGAARAIWADLADRYPAAYYGVAARARLEEAGGARPPAAPAPSAPDGHDPGALEQDPRFRAAVTLLRLGLRRAAAEELNAIDGEALDDRDARPALLVAELLHRAGDPRAASLLLRTVGRGALRGAPHPGNVAAWRVAYPRAFRQHVERWAPGVDVAPDLFHALIREESALDPRAVSPAGAVGLSQLMLPTAREVARTLRLRPPSRRDLADPGLSIRIGTRYLAQLVRRFGGSIPLALAAYNAGPSAVSRWLREHGELEVDEFVEEIPYDETRTYVKRVLRSFAAYRLLHGAAPDAPLALRLSLPAGSRVAAAKVPRAAARHLSRPARAAPRASPP